MNNFKLFNSTISFETFLHPKTNVDLTHLQLEYGLSLGALGQSLRKGLTGKKGTVRYQSPFITSLTPVFYIRRPLTNLAIVLASLVSRLYYDSIRGQR